MKSLAKFLAGVTLVVVAVLAYLILGSGLSAQVHTDIIPASERLEEYARMTGAETGAEDSFIVQITVEAKNRGMIPAEWAELHFTTLEGDALAYNVSAGPQDIAAFQSATFTASIVTRNAGGRGIWLSYYLMGRERVAE